MNSCLTLMFFCWCLARGYAYVRWAYGDFSAIQDDAPSVVYCPDGFYVGECSCVDESNCDGTRLDPTNIRKCTAHNRWRATKATKALAKCAPLSHTTGVKMVKQRRYARQYVYCPTGYIMESCTLFDPYTQERQTYYLKTEDSCAYEVSCASHRPADISIVCTLFAYH